MLWMLKPAAGGGGVTDHGALTGLADDDHLQYLNNARGDVRYNTKAEITTFLAGKANLSHTHVAVEITNFNAAALAAAPAETATSTGTLINSAATKATPVDADQIGLMDSTASNILRKLSWLNVKNTLKTYFDTLYATVSHSITGHSGFPGGTTTFLRADGTFAAAGGGTPVAIQDEGTNITAAVSTINFVGAGVTVTGDAVAVVTIPGGGGGGTDLTYAVDTRLLSSSTGADVTLPPDSGPSRLYAFNDMLTTTNDTTFTFGQTGTGAGVSVNGGLPDGGVGWVNFALGTTATGRVSCNPALNCMRLGLGRASYACRMRQLVLSDAVNAAFTQRFGFLVSVTGESAHGAFFRYTHSVNGGRWEAVTRNNNVETAVDTGITVAINTTYKLGIVVNAAGTSAEFFINGSLVATITTNIPTIATREVGAGMMVLRSVGTAASTPISVDYLQVEQVITAAR